jgi:manganese transport protein
LSIQRPFTLIPLLLLCRNRTIMGAFKSSKKEFATAMAISTIVIILNIYLFYTTIAG